MSWFKQLFNKEPKAPVIDLTKRFDLLGRVGRGTMSKVWRARDTNTGKTVAVKVLDKEKTKQFEARFAGLNKPTEGEVAVQLKHPNIVTTFEHGVTKDGEQVLVMEFIEGVGLSYLIDTQNETMQEHRVNLMVQLGDAIDYFHRSHWIHRDICPPNVLVDRSQRVKMIDFGLVVPDTPDFRRPGNRTGKANYMAPELMKRQKTDQRIDIFSYAVTCYEMYTKQLPWKPGETIEMMVRHLNQPPKDIRELVNDINPKIADAIMRGLAQSPDDRWKTVGDMVAAIRKAT